MIKKKEPSKKDYLITALVGRLKSYYMVGRAEEAYLDCKRLLNTTENPNTRFAVYHEMYKSYNLAGDNQNALKCVDNAEKITKSSQNVIFKIRVMGMRSTIFNAIGDYDSSIKASKKAVILFENRIKTEKNKDEIDSIKMELADSLNNLGQSYYQQGLIEKAIFYYLKASKLVEKGKNQLGMLMAYNNIGLIKQQQNDFKGALEYFEKALNISEKVGYKPGLATIWGNIGLIYKNMEIDDIALDHFQRSLDVSRELNIKPGIAIDLNNIALIFLTQKKYELALKYFYESHEICSKYGYIFANAMILSNIANTYYHLKNYSKALKYAEYSLNISKNKNMGEIIVRSMVIIGNVYREKKMYKKSAVHLENAIEEAKKYNIVSLLNDSILSYLITLTCIIEQKIKHVPKNIKENIVFLEKYTAGIQNKLEIVQTFLIIIRYYIAINDIATARKKYEEILELEKDIKSNAVKKKIKELSKVLSQTR